MLKILRSGIYTSVQDLGRFGYAAMGVPISGAMDQFSASLANAILNNPKHAAVLEITLGATSFEFVKPTLICITGGDFSAKLNGNPIPLHTAISIKRGAILTLGKQHYGVRTYIGIKGGFQSQKVLGSWSFYKGITTQYRLLKNDILPYTETKEEEHHQHASIKINRAFFDKKVITCYPGPEFDLLTKSQQEQLSTTTFRISNENNRMGYRLQELLPNELPQILTSAVIPGTVQLTPSGKIIVLMRDCQVTGGYPRILQLTEEAINILSQKTTNDSFSFEVIL